MRVLVLGGGVIGIAAAYFLAADGHEVTVLEAHPEPGSETSYANAGLVAPGHAFAWGSPTAPLVLLKSLVKRDQALRLKLSADPRLWAWMLAFLRQCTAERARINTIRKLRLCLHSLEMLHEVVAATGVEYDGRRGGNLYLHRSRAGFERGLAHAQILADHGLPIEAADPDRIAEIEPAFEAAKERLAGAIFCPVDESGDARAFTRNLARHIEARLGVALRLGVRIREIATAGGEVEQVLTDSGAYRADRYVLALGCASERFARALGLRLPIYPVKGYSVTLPVNRESNAAPRVAGVDAQNLVAWSRLGERLRLTATAEFSGYDRSYTPADFRTMLASGRELFPEAADYSRGEHWAGLRPMTPEGTPVLGPSPLANLLLNTGHGHIGWTMACGSGQLTADFIAGRTPAIDTEGLVYGAR